MRYPAAVLGILASFCCAASPAEPPSEAGKVFTTKIQPILANACAACHAAPDAGSFVLRRSTPGASALPATTQFNQAAAQAQIDRTTPENSKLLKKAVTAHGGARQPAVKDVNSPAYRQLEHWVKLVAGDGRPSENPAAKNQITAVDPFDPAIFNHMTPRNH